MSVSVVFLLIAVILFGLGAFSRWWNSPQPMYPPLVCAGLFFWSLSSLWPMITK